MLCWLVGSNLCPDEKGTERLVVCAFRPFAPVATYAPMKRGLKVSPNRPMGRDIRCSNLCPDEKGTERLA